MRSSMIYRGPERLKRMHRFKVGKIVSKVRRLRQAAATGTQIMKCTGNLRVKVTVKMSPKVSG